MCRSAGRAAKKRLKSLRLARVQQCKASIFNDVSEVRKMVMETVQIRLTDKQIKNIETLVKKGVYPNRSEAVRDAVRKLVEEAAE